MRKKWAGLQLLFLRFSVGWPFFLSDAQPARPPVRNGPLGSACSGLAVCRMELAVPGGASSWDSFSLSVHSRLEGPWRLCCLNAKCCDYHFIIGKAQQHEDAFVATLLGY